MNIVFKIHLKLYKWKNSTIKLISKMFQGQKRLFILYISQEIWLTLLWLTGIKEKNCALFNTTHTHHQIYSNCSGHSKNWHIRIYFIHFKSQEANSHVFLILRLSDPGNLECWNIQCGLKAS